MYHIKFLSSEEQKLLIILMKDVRRNMRKNSPPTLHTTWKTFPVCERGVRRDAMSALWVVHDERSFILLLWLSLREAGKQNPAALWHPRRGKDTGLVSQFHLSERMCVPAQSYPTFCDPIDCSPPGSSVHGILQARILEWVAMPSSRGASPPQGSNPCLLPSVSGISRQANPCLLPSVSGISRQANLCLLPSVSGISRQALYY